MDRYSHLKQRELTSEEQKQVAELYQKGYAKVRLAHEIWMRQYKESSNRKESSKAEETESPS